MDPYVGEIRAVAFNFAPAGWALCAGQLMPISQNTALFSLLGTYYGGDGQTTFALPDLRGRVAINQGQGPGLSPYDLGQAGGDEGVALLVSEMPAHTHGVMATIGAATTTNPAGALYAEASINGTKQNMYGPQTTVAMAGPTVATAGHGFAHENRQPFLAVTYIIALQGVFPPRN